MAVDNLDAAYSAGSLREFAECAFQAVGVPADDAATTVANRIEANGRGVDRPGVTVSRGRINRFAKQNVEIPLRWALDQEGRPASNSHAALRGTLPPMGDHEGYALALIVDLLSGVTSSAKNGVHFAGHLAEYCRPPHNVGGLFAAASVDSFMGVGQFRGRADQSHRELKKSSYASGGHRIHAPGEIEHETRLRRSHEGIPLPAEVVGDFQALASELGIHFPEAM